MANIELYFLFCKPKMALFFTLTMENEAIFRKKFWSVRLVNFSKKKHF